MLRALPMLILLCGLMITAGCDDGPAVDPDLTGIVVDESGHPVVGAAVGIMYRIEGHPILWGPDKTSPDKPQNTFSFVLLDPQSVRIEIHSYNHQLVRVIFDGELQARGYEFVWDGTNDSGQFVLPGVYYVKIIRENGPVEERDVFKNFYEPEEIFRARHATTNHLGKFRISRDLLAIGEVMEFLDEQGEVVSSSRISHNIKVMAVVENSGVLTSTSAVVTLDEGEAGIHVELTLH